MNLFWFATSTFVGWMLAMHAHAFSGGNCSPQGATAINMAPIIAPSNPQAGQVIGLPEGYPFNAPAFVMQCRYDFWSDFHWVTATINAVNANATGRTFSANGMTMPVFATGLPGVGFAMMARDPNHGFAAVGQSAASLLRVKYPKPVVWGLQGRLYLVATGGAISPGTAPTRTVAHYRVQNTNTSAPGYHPVNMQALVISPPLKPTCRVSTPSITMPLGTVPVKAFAGVGSHAGSVTRNITLSCAGGTGGTRDVFITVTDHTSRSNRSDVLSLTASSLARGVALQLVRSGNILVRYGADSSSVGNPNQWLVGTTGNATVQIPLTARYIQTQPTITPGSASGVATFTMSYR
ncbi:fimbrial protein [Pseudomonas carnis]|nr:fimbrial protein [Pseudomonas carnis]